MRLRKLWIGHYANLNDLHLTFQALPMWQQRFYGSTSVRFFVGLNGSGKTNTLKAIGLIFSHLAAGAQPGFAFDVEYELLELVVRITTQPERLAREGISAPLVAPVQVAILAQPRLTGAEIVWNDSHVIREWSSSGGGLLPSRVVGFATGPNQGLQWALSRSIERLLRERAGDQEEPTRPEGMTDSAWERHLEEQRTLAAQEREQYLDNPFSLFLEHDDALCAVLALLAYPGSREQHDAAGRDLLSQVGLRARRPLGAFSLLVPGDWEKRLTPARQASLRSLLRVASALTPIDGLRTLLLEQPPPDFYATFDMDANMEQHLTTQFPSPFRFFEELLAWKRQQGVRSLHLAVTKESYQGLLPATALSDGEYLFLGRFALLLMLRDLRESLILLDEPETHFNDQWKADLVQELCRLLDKPRLPETDADYQDLCAPSLTTSEVIIATHSAITLSDAAHTQVHVFRSAEGTVRARAAYGRTFGGDLDDLSARMAESESSTGNLAESSIQRKIETSRSVEELELLLSVVGTGLQRLKVVEALRKVKQ